MDKRLQKYIFKLSYKFEYITYFGYIKTIYLIYKTLKYAT